MIESTGTALVELSCLILILQRPHLTGRRRVVCDAHRRPTHRRRHQLQLRENQKSSTELLGVYRVDGQSTSYTTLTICPPLFYCRHNHYYLFALIFGTSGVHREQLAFAQGGD